MKYEAPTAELRWCVHPKGLGVLVRFAGRRALLCLGMLAVVGLTLLTADRTRAIDAAVSRSGARGILRGTGEIGNWLSVVKVIRADFGAIPPKFACAHLQNTRVLSTLANKLERGSVPA